MGSVATNSTDLVSSGDIKTYVDTEVAGAGGGSVTDTLMIEEENDSSYNTTLSSDIRHVIWHRNKGNSGGGQMSFMLPVTADIVSGHTILFHCFQKHTDLTSNNGGTILLKCQSDQEVRHTSHDDPHIDQITSGTGGRSKFHDVNRNTFAAHFFISGSTKYWFLRSLMYRPEDATLNQITSNTRYFKHFVNTEAGYTPSSGNIFPIPSGYHEALIFYGDGTNYGWGTGGSNQGLGVNIELPVANLIDGQKVIMHSTMDYSSSNATQCLRLNFPGSVSGTPNTRRVCHLGVESLGNASGGTRIVCPSSNNHTRNHTYVYCSASDVWILRIDTN
jgi:hypothetical protein